MSGFDPNQPSSDPRRRSQGGNSQKRRQGEAPRKKMDLSNFFDVSIRCALMDEHFRIKAADWNKLIAIWQLGGEDVVIRGQYDKSEVQIVLRGRDNARLRVSHAQPSRKLPIFVVHTCEELRKDMLEQRELLLGQDEQGHDNEQLQR